MSAFTRAGILYGKLGLDTPAETIESRYAGIEAAAEALELDQIPELMRVIFGKCSSDQVGFLEHFKSDPRFDVRAHDKEAALLAVSIADFVMSKEMSLAGSVALTLLAASMGGIRQPVIPSDILEQAEGALADFQSRRRTLPTKRKLIGPPAALAEAIAAIKAQPASHTALPNIIPSVIEAFEQLGAYATISNQNSTRTDNSLLNYISQLEEETRIHWWVVGGWSDEGRGSYRNMALANAAIQAGWDLASKNETPTGVYAAPALLDLVIEKGRDEMPELTLEALATKPTLAWRKANFESLSGNDLISLLPISATFALSAASEDEPDWKPAFFRKTGVEPSTALTPLAVAVQIYREQLARRMFES